MRSCPPLLSREPIKFGSLIFCEILRKFFGKRKLLGLLLAYHL